MHQYEKPMILPFTAPLLKTVEGKEIYKTDTLHLDVNYLNLFTSILTHKYANKKG